jgi:hypothetical protein
VTCTLGRWLETVLTLGMGIEAQTCVSCVRFGLSRRRETVSTHGVGIEAQPCVSGVRFGLDNSLDYQQRLLSQTCI